MNSTPVRKWHIARWPALGWLETIIKLFALVIGIASGWRALAGGHFSLPSGWQWAPFVLLTLLSLGLLAAIFDRWTDKELIAMAFVIVNNLGHWGMVLGMTTPTWPETSLLQFAGLMLLGDLVKLAFIRTHDFTVREYSSSLLIRLTSIYISGYAFLIIIVLLLR